MRHAIDGYYLNLDRAEVRRANLEAELQKHGVSESYARFPGVDGRTLPRRGNTVLKPGELGAFRAHLDVLIRAASSPGRYVHVLEDDVVLSASMKPYIDHAVKLGLFSVFDVVFLDFAFGIDFQWMQTYRSHTKAAFAKPVQALLPSDFKILDVELPYYLGLYSYIVNPESLPKLIATCEAEWAKGRLPIDHVFRREIRAGRLRAGAVVPFLTSVRIEDALTTQADRVDDLDLMLAHAMLRKSFFVERDLAELNHRADALLAQLAQRGMPDAHAELLVKLVRCFAA